MKKTLTEFLFVACPKAVGGVGTLVLNLVLLRFLGGETAAAYGAYSLCVAIILMADGIFGTAFDMGVLRLAPLYRTDNPSRSYSIERAALRLKAALILGVGLALSLLARPLANVLFGNPEQKHLIYISSAAAGGLLLLRSAQVHAQVDRRFHLYGLMDLLHSALKFGGIAVLLVFFAASPARVLLFFAAAPACVALVFLGAFARRLIFGGDTERGATAELVKFIRWFLGTFFLTTLVSKLDLLMLPVVTRDLHEVGIFAGALVLTMIPELLGVYLSVVFSPRIMPYCREGRFADFFRRFQVGFTGFALMLLAVAFFSLGFLREHLLPGSFAPSATVFLILLPGALAAMVSFPLTIQFLMFVRPAFLVAMESILLLPVGVAYYYAIRDHGAVGAAWVTTASRVLKAVLAQAAAFYWSRHKSPEIEAL